MKAYADLADLPEDERIAIMCQVVALSGQIVGFVVEDNEKADRYVKKLGKRVRVIDRGPGPVSGTILVRIGPCES